MQLPPALSLPSSRTLRTRLRPLVEGAPRFLARLAAHRPFETDVGLVRAMRDVSRELSEEEAAGLVRIATSYASRGEKFRTELERVG